MLEVVNHGIAVEDVPIKLDSVYMEDSKQLTLTESTKASVGNGFSGLLDDSSQFKGTELPSSFLCLMNDDSELEEGEFRSNSGLLGGSLEYGEVESLNRSSSPINVQVVCNVTRSLEQVELTTSVGVRLRDKDIDMLEVIDPMIVTECEDVALPRINVEYGSTEKPKQFTDTDSSMTSNVCELSSLSHGVSQYEDRELHSRFSSLLEDVFEHDEVELLNKSLSPVNSEVKFCEVAMGLKQTELVAFKSDGNHNEENRLRVDRAADASKSLESFMPETEIYLEPVAMECSVADHQKLNEPKKSLESIPMECQKVTAHLDPTAMECPKVIDHQVFVEREINLERITIECPKVTDMLESIMSQTSILMSNRKVSARRDFPQGCGRRALILDKSERLNLIASSNRCVNVNVFSRPREGCSGVSENIRQNSMGINCIGRKNKENITTRVVNKVNLKWEMERSCKERTRDTDISEVKTREPATLRTYQSSTTAPDNSSLVLPRQNYGRKNPPIPKPSKDDGKDRKIVNEILWRFYELFKEFTHQEAAKSMHEKHTRRIDLEVLKKIKAERICSNVGKAAILGHISGVEVGDQFHYRVELHLIGLHRPLQAGIDYMGNGNAVLATSIVASGGYADYATNNGNVLKYSGQGGNPSTSKNKCPEDQKLDGGNLALKHSKDQETPVRVIRGFKDSMNSKGVMTYTYDGLYTVVECCQQKGPHGFNVFMFTLKRIPGQSALFGRNQKKGLIY